MAQQQHSSSSSSQDNVEETVLEATQTSPATGDVDDLLDEIDSVLESNSEEFVRNFVQKGGQ